MRHRPWTMSTLGSSGVVSCPCLCLTVIIVIPFKNTQAVVYFLYFKFIMIEFHTFFSSPRPPLLNIQNKLLC